MFSSRVFVSTVLFGVSAAEQWAVLVAGSSGWLNYRHQADVCHAYHMVSQSVPKENIIVMMTDDAATSTYNHEFPGQLFNKPGSPAVDVRKNCMIDYSGDDVTPDNFLGVLNGTASGKRLESVKDDDVFIYFADHGAPGLISFPPIFTPTYVDQQVHKQELQSTIAYMHNQKMFKKLVFYLETCESGSMFEGMSTPGVYAVSAAGPDEPSHAAYCGDDAKVDGKTLDTCLGDLFSISWMERAEAEGTQESLESEYTAVKKLVTESSVEQWGDLSFKTDMVSEFVGDVHSDEVAVTPVGTISVREIRLKWAYDRYVRASTPDERLAAGEALQQTINDQLAAEMAYERFLEIVYPNNMEKRAAARLSAVPANLPECELSTRRAFGTNGRFDSSSAFSLQFHRYIVNVCADVAESGANVDLPEAARLACSPDFTVV